LAILSDSFFFFGDKPEWSHRYFVASNTVDSYLAIAPGGRGFPLKPYDVFTIQFAWQQATSSNHLLKYSEEEDVKLTTSSSYSGLKR
jgi:hypothetical protein